MPWKAQHTDDFPSLGWQLLDWWADHLPSPRDPASKLLFTDEQAMQLVEWFRVNPVTGKLAYRRGYSRRAKGWGKSPVEAAKAIAEFAGPVRFAGWDAAGQPVGMPWGTKDAAKSWVQIGAVSEDQTDNTWSVVYYFLTENDGRAADDLRIDAGLTRCFLRDQPGAKLEPVTASAGSREGQPITYGVIDESHLMLPTNGGVKLAHTIRRNVAKMGGRSYETTNSYLVGQGSVAETSHQAVLKGAPGIFADEVEAPREVNGVTVNLAAPDDVLLAALTPAYGDSWWVDKERLVADVRDPAAPWEESARFFFNWPQRDNENGPVSLQRWSELADESSIVVGPMINAIDVSDDMQWAAVAGAGRRADGRLHVEITEHKQWTDWVVDWCKRQTDMTFRIASSSKAAYLIPLLEEAGVSVVTVSAQEFGSCCSRFVAACGEGNVRHLGGGKITAALANATMRQSGDVQVWARVRSSGDISALVAATIAVGGVSADDAAPLVRF